MKTKSMQHESATEPGPLPVPGPRSAEMLLHIEIAALGAWLAAQGLDLHSDTAHADEGSRDRLYWRYGYLVGLQHAQALLTNCGATLH
jgi:hypothetical protein